MSLRARVVRSGVYLTLRQGLGIAIGTVGMILIIRAIGPEAYGLYAAAGSIEIYFFVICRFGIDAYLVRRREEPQPHDYHQAFTLYLLLGLAGAVSAVLALPFLDRWMGIEGFGPVYAAMLVTLPVQLSQLTPMARIQRALDFQRVALIELSGQIALYVVALPLAYQGLGPWALVIGMWTQYLLILGSLYRVSGYRPQLYWESARVRAMVGYGIGYSANGWVYELRHLINPLIVGRYAGAEAVGQVALAIRLLEQFNSVVELSFVRVALPVFARLQEDRARLVKAVNEGTSLQPMILGPLLAGFALVAPWVIPLLVGPEWLPMLEVYPLLAVSYLSRAVFSMQAAALQVLRRIWELATFSLVYIVLFAGLAFLLVPHLGLIGYGWAAVAGTILGSYIPLSILGRVYIGRISHTQAGVWFTAWAIPLFSWQLGSWAWISPILPLIWPPTRRELWHAIVMVLKSTPRP